MSPEGKINKNEEVIKKISNSFLKRFLSAYDTYFEIENIEKRKEEFLKNIEDRMQGIAGTNKDIEKNLLEIIEKEKNTQIEPISKWIENLATKLAEEVSKNFSLNDLEQKFKELILTKGNTLEINRLFTYKINDEGHKINLHSPVIFEENPIVIKKLVNEAMEKLSEKLQTDPNLKNVEKIEARSTVFFYHPNIFNEYGFELTKKEEESKLYTVTVSKEKFLETLNNKK